MQLIKLNRIKPVPSDIAIARAHPCKPVAQLAREIGLTEDEYELYGKFKAKITKRIPIFTPNSTKGKYVVITGITPTPLGEGWFKRQQNLLTQFIFHISIIMNI